MAETNPISQYGDAVHVAAQLGRLDLVTLLLTCVAVILALGGIFAFLSVRSIAKKEAAKVAEKTAGKISEACANKYLQEKLPEILEAYRVFIENRVSDEVANQIALEQDNDGENV